MSGWTSAHLIGRAKELEALDEALEDAKRGQASVLLVGGEAGVGKSRLLQEFASRARVSAIVAEGRCIEQGDGALTYAPIVGLIRHVLRQRGAENVRALLDEATATDLAALAPALGTGGQREPSRTRLFEAVVTLVDALASEQPVVLIVEDVHWADAATKDLLLYLASNLQGSGVLLVMSHREVGPSSSVTAFRVSVMRMSHAASLQLAALTVDESGEQLESIIGARPTPAVIREVHGRSGGLPIFIEALIRPDGTVRDAMPGDLRELIIAGVHELPPETQESMHAASVGGFEVEAALLAAVTEIEPGELARRLRPAVESGLMLADDTAYRFRHELLREAVREGELLPGERATYHRAYALAMENHAEWDPERGRDGRIALHWRGALDHDRALRSSWEVARRARESGAFAEELRMLEQTLSVWGRVSDPEKAIGVDRTEVLEAAVDAACWAAQSERGLALAEAALELMTGEPDPKRAGMLLQRASLRQQLMLPGYVDDLAEAGSIDGVPPAAKIEILGQLARACAATEDLVLAERNASELRRIASESPDPVARFESIATDVLLGAEGGIEVLRPLIAEAADGGHGWSEALGWMAAVRVALRFGSHREAVELGRSAIDRLRELGLTEYSGAAVAADLATAQVELGQRAAALDTVREALSLDPAPNGRAALLLAEAAAQVASGESRHAERALAEFDALVAGRHPEPALTRQRARLDAEVRAERGRTRRDTVPHGLTQREVEVLTLISEGLSNKEIATQLFISTKTASVHVSNILRKLDVPARGAAVALAYREAIIDAPTVAASTE